MADILSKIIEVKRGRLEAAKSETPAELLYERAVEVRRNAKRHALVHALDASRINVIAEFKRRSPSKGQIRPDANPSEIARSYELGGACAVSVLTEKDFFGGTLDDLVAVRKTVSIPVLRKDFIFDAYQVLESAAAGADALLLIAAVLENEDLRMLKEMAEDKFEMDALVEVHTKDEMKRAIGVGSRLIGINNRDLRNFDVSLEISEELATGAPKGTKLVSESGLATRSDIERLRTFGFSGFLVGESLMRAQSPEAVLRELLV